MQERKPTNTDAFIEERNQRIDRGVSHESLRSFDIANIPIALYLIADILSQQNTLLIEQKKILTALGSRIGGYRG